MTIDGGGWGGGVTAASSLNSPGELAANFINQFRVLEATYFNAG